MSDNATFVLQILWCPEDILTREKLELARKIVFIMESQKEMQKKQEMVEKEEMVKKQEMLKKQEMSCWL